MKKIFKNTVVVSTLTFGSRILGLVRDSLIAMYFGTSFQTDAFFIAFRPFELMRKLFAEGILGLSFVPIFSETLEKDGHSKALSIVFSMFCILCTAGIVIVLAGIFLAPLIIRLIAPGFEHIPYKAGLTIVLFKLMLPYFWLILMTAICMGVLNSFDNFAVPALAPVMFNLAVITAAIIVPRYFKVPVIGLAMGVTLGGVLQLVIHIPLMVHFRMLPGSFSQFFNNIMPARSKVMRILKTMFPCMIGAASYQINITAASFFASRLEEGSVSFIYYAERLVQFPLALFTVSVATVFLPDLSRKAAMGRMDEIGQLFSNGARLVFFVTIPAMAGLMALDTQVITLLFGRGVFDPESVRRTAACLFFLVTGLWAFTGVRLFVTLYYALSQIKIPFYSGMISIGLNLVLCSVLIEPFGLKGLVISVCLSSVAGFAVLFMNIPGIVKLNKRKIVVSACRSLFLSGIMFVLVRFAGSYMAGLVKPHTGWYAACTAGLICFGVVFYFTANLIISSPELAILKQGITGMTNEQN